MAFSLVQVVKSPLSSPNFEAFSGACRSVPFCVLISSGSGVIAAMERSAIAEEHPPHFADRLRGLFFLVRKGDGCKERGLLPFIILSSLLFFGLGDIFSSDFALEVTAFER